MFFLFVIPSLFFLKENREREREKYTLPVALGTTIPRKLFFELFEQCISIHFYIIMKSIYFLTFIFMFTSSLPSFFFLQLCDRQPLIVLHVFLAFVNPARPSIYNVKVQVGPFFSFTCHFDIR